MYTGSLIPTKEIIERIQFENPWWIEESIPHGLKQMEKRLYFKLFFPLAKSMEVRRALILLGPRRVGKTVMLYHTIQTLIEGGTDPRKIIFAGVDNPIFMQLGLQEILSLSMESLKIKELNGYYVFFDEIQYLKDWERHLKVMVDSYPNSKFIVSGSAAAALQWHSTESGAGRFTDFLLPPLTFHEFIHLRKLNNLTVPGSIRYGDKLIDYILPTNLTELNKQFEDYINFGGYPEIVLSTGAQKDLSRFVKGDILDKVLLRDLPSLYGISDIQELYRFFTYLAYNTGKEFTYEKISKERGITKILLKKYIEYLESAFLIKVLHRVDMTAKKMHRVVNFKVYLTSPSLRTALFSPLRFRDDDMGNIVETTIMSQWMHRSGIQLTFAQWREGRSSGEVDMVGIDKGNMKILWAVEIKWSNRYFHKPKELSSLVSFCNKNNLANALITTIDITDNIVEEGVNITCIPAAVYALNTGRNTIERGSGN